MNLTPQLREQVDLAILRKLEEHIGSRFGLNEGVLRQMINAEGFDLDADQFSAECEYLAHPSKGLIERIGKVIVPASRAWRLTPAGRDQLEESA